MPSTKRASSTGSGVFEPAGDGDGRDCAVWVSAPARLLCRCAARGLGLFIPGLPRELFGPPEDILPRPGCEEAEADGPLSVLAPSPNPTRLALPSSLMLLVLDAASSKPGPSLILSASSASLPLAQVVRPPTLPVALALPTVLFSFRPEWLSK